MWFFSDKFVVGRKCLDKFYRKAIVRKCEKKFTKPSISIEHENTQVLLPQVFEQTKSKALTAQHNEAQLINPCLSLEYLSKVICFKEYLLYHREPLRIWGNSILEFAHTVWRIRMLIFQKKNHALVSGSQDTHTHSVSGFLHAHFS